MNPGRPVAQRGSSGGDAALGIPRVDHPGDLPEGTPQGSRGTPDFLLCRLEIPLREGSSFLERASKLHPRNHLLVRNFMFTADTLLLDIDTIGPDSLESLVPAVVDSPDVIDVERFMPGKGAGFLRVRCTLSVSCLASVFQAAGILPELPCHVQGGTVSILLVAETNRFHRLICGIQDLNPKTKIASIRHGLTQRSTKTLSPRQREAFQLALHAGYWDIPKRIGLGDLALVLGVTKPTTSKLLAQVESKLLREMADVYFAPLGGG